MMIDREQVGLIPDTSTLSSGAQQEDARARIVFPHIMKTAGTSINHWIQRHYTLDEVLWDASVWRQLWRLSPEQWQRKRFVRGHFGSYICKYFGRSQGFVAIALLRDPIDRVISHFWHTKRAKEGVLYRLVSPETFTFDDFIDHPSTHRLASNFQTANYGYDLQKDYGTKALAPRLVFRSRVTETELRHAMRFLDGCEVIGLTEDLPTFVDDLSRRFGFYPERRLARNRSYREQTFKTSPIQRRKLERLNELDFELYRYARKKMKELSSTRTYSVVRRRNPLNTLETGSARWTPTEPFWGEGWSDIQAANDATSVPHRWTLGRIGSIVFEVRPSTSYRLEFCVLRFVAPDQEKGLRIEAGGQSFSVERLYRDESHGPAGGRFSAEVLSGESEQLEVQFVVTPPMSFNEVNPTDSDRTKRGLALTSATLMSVARP